MNRGVHADELVVQNGAHDDVLTGNAVTASCARMAPANAPPASADEERQPEVHDTDQLVIDRR
jgi:hypothetical protein